MYNLSFDLRAIAAIRWRLKADTLTLNDRRFIDRLLKRAYDSRYLAAGAAVDTSDMPPFAPGVAAPE
jgi:hypothetical protein